MTDNNGKAASQLAGNVDALTQFVAGGRERALPPEVLNAARMCLSDWVSVAIGAKDEAAGQVVRSRVKAMRSGGKSVVVFGGTAAPALAALANGTLAHCLDFDDTHIGATTHTSAPVWAATLALAQEHGADEALALRAFVTGFEVAARVGRGMGQVITSKGLHATGVFGRIGAAAASAVVLGLSAEQAGHALGAAATQASGLTASFGTMAKPFHAGKAAMDGVLAAELALEGFVAAPQVLEAHGGLDRAIVQDGSVTMAPVTFGKWEILNNSFKPYAACHLTHPTIDAARAVGVDPNNVKVVQATVSEIAQQITGGTDGQPQTPLAAKFDLRYCTALALFGGTASAADFAQPWTLAPHLGALANKVQTHADASVGYASARLTVEMNDGRTEEVEIATGKGHPGNPMTWDDMRAKYDTLAPAHLGGASEKVFGLLQGFGDPSRKGGASLEELRRCLMSLA
jgi:2-methylcitrate dehydratase PrpD